jgi:DNA modification methylase
VASSTHSLKIGSPKRTTRTQVGWSAFFPYYAGFPETFARNLLASADLPVGATILDPWNGSGTTTFAAAQLGYASRGFDLNPVMVAVAKSRLLAATEADSIEPLAKEVVRSAREQPAALENDPLAVWFGPSTTAHVRAIEASIRRHLVGTMTIAPDGAHLEKMSSIGATFYVALFSVCRQLVARFQSSNPTWLRTPRDEEVRIGAWRSSIETSLVETLRSMAMVLADKSKQTDLLMSELGKCEIGVADTAATDLNAESVDLILTSPPYCTRIDYTAATRVELAAIAPLVEAAPKDLARQMIGSTCVPTREITPSADWGETCRAFLNAVRSHSSKASGGYYYKTHLDYFDKMSRSIPRLSNALKENATAVLIVQDSYYKDVHNDLPQIISEMAKNRGLKLTRRENFHLKRSMSDVNPRSRVYGRPRGATEAVLCFQKAT